VIGLTADEQDMVTELMNVGVGHAAAAFSRMVGEEIRMTVPSVEVCDRALAGSLLYNRLPGVLGGVRQTFDGAMTGLAALIFPERQSLQIVRTVLRHGDYPLEEISELEEETFLEIGNIVLNHCLGTIANTLDLTCRSSLPQPFYDRDTGLALTDGAADGIVLFLHITFSIQSIDSQGYLVFLLDMAGAETFLNRIRRHIDQLLQG
jgi:chemotaxis protein CheC